MQSEVYEEIRNVMDKITGINGVIGVVLFGSYSRGDFDEGSDVDLLVVFRDKKGLEKNLEDIYKITSKSNLFLQVLGLTQKELMSSPLLRSVLREGKIYYANENLKGLLTPIHEPYALITYSTTNLSSKGKVIFAQKLEGRGKGKYKYYGLLQELGGFKVGRGVLMVPLRNLKAITEHMEEKGVNYVIRYVWA